MMKEKRHQGSKLSRRSFDLIFLFSIGMIVAAAAIVRHWPIGCSADGVVDRARESLRQETGASEVTLHLIETVSRSQGRLNCTASARIEHADRDPEHRDVKYLAQTDRDGRLVGVQAVLEPGAR